jgi:chromosome segregation ATPase
MRRIVPFIVFALALALSSSVHAQSETDKLREALRSITGQLRSLEDQRGALQTKLTDAERERDRFSKQNATLRAQIKEAEASYRQAVKDFNDRLAERDDALEKWKSAYGEAADVARAKDAERTKFESEAAALKTSKRACEAKNAELVRVGNDIVKQYEAMNPLEKIWDHEPVFGLKRVEHQNAAQDFRDKILDQKVTP